MSSHCRILTTALNDMLATEEGSAVLLGLESPSVDDLILAIGEYITPELAPQVLREWLSLPQSFLPTFYAAWREARTHGVQFTMESLPPEKPIESARAGRVSWTFEADEGGMRMIVSHVEGRHASWFQSAESASVT